MLDALLPLSSTKGEARARQLHTAGIVADMPFAALDVLVRDDADALLLHVDPAALTVLLRPALDIAATRQSSVFSASACSG